MVYKGTHQKHEGGIALHTRYIKILFRRTLERKQGRRSLLSFIYAVEAEAESKVIVVVCFECKLAIMLFKRSSVRL